MPLRVLIALLALSGLTGFAPAPFPRTPRVPADIDLNTFQGSWKTVSMKRVLKGGAFNAVKWPISHIRIQNDRWEFVNRSGSVNATYYVRIDTSKEPRTIDWHTTRGGPVTLKGIIRRNRKNVEILYLASTVRPASFEKAPAGYWLLTLKPDKN